MEIVKGACKLLAKNLIWCWYEYDCSDVDADLDEFNEMSNKFYEIAYKHLAQLDGLTKQDEILASAINFIDRVLSCPPLRGQYEWFDNGLSLLLEICNPNTLVTENEIRFLEYIEKGIEKYKANKVDE